ncbi:MAG: hypothetical protein M3Q74_06100 [Pseudomonadota bacterium]|nr:hypothetical protein [Pseudomonadota bacterium]
MTDRPISFGELYGGEAGEAAGSAPADARALRIEVPYGTSPPATNVPFPVRSIRADNPSGYWYRVAGQLVPPWTVAGILRLDRPVTAVEVVVGAPAGQTSEVLGANLVLVAYEADYPPSAGVHLPPQRGYGLRRASLTMIATTSGGFPVAQVVVPEVAGQRFGVVSLAGMLSWDTRNRMGLTTVYIGWLNTLASVETQAVVTVGPAAPHSPDLRFDPPLAWPAPGTANVGDAGIYAVGRQFAADAPATVRVDVGYLVLAQ